MGKKLDNLAGVGGDILKGVRDGFIAYGIISLMRDLSPSPNENGFYISLVGSGVTFLTSSVLRIYDRFRFYELDNPSFPRRKP